METVYQLLARTWMLPILRTLDEADAGYTELKRLASGISHKMLDDTLRRLVAANLIARRTMRPTYQGPRGMYHLTETGVGLMAKLRDFETWAKEYGFPV